MVAISVFALITFAFSPLGITLIATIVASRPRMTITTISSTSVKPSSWRRLRVADWRELCMAVLIMGLLAGKGVELQDRQQDGKNDGRDDAAHQHDDRR